MTHKKIKPNAEFCHLCGLYTEHWTAVPDCPSLKTSESELNVDAEIQLISNDIAKNLRNLFNKQQRSEASRNLRKTK
jgi:hypothetical protein